MRHQAAAHDLVGRYGRVEATGHQHQGLLQRAQRISADAVVLAVDHEQPLVANFDPDFDFRRFQVDPGGAALATQLAADVFFDVHRAERVLARTLAAHRENFPGQRIAVVLPALFGDVVEVAQRVLVDLQKVRDARHAGQALTHLFQGFRVGNTGFQLEIVPHAVHHHGRIQITEHGADVFGQLADKFRPDRSTLDGDLGEDFYD
ncbi:hypothetical protein D9M71_625390 [compost metagenome]